jgi:hypothetical protein
VKLKNRDFCSFIWSTLQGFFRLSDSFPLEDFFDSSKVFSGELWIKENCPKLDCRIQNKTFVKLPSILYGGILSNYLAISAKNWEF